MLRVASGDKIAEIAIVSDRVSRVGKAFQSMLLSKRD
jgi:hypothetical protein